MAAGEMIPLNILACARHYAVAPLNGKYYGTEICDEEGRGLFVVWGLGHPDGEPSARTIQQFGSGYSPEVWAEYCTDSHWESRDDLALAESLVLLLNRATEHP